MSWLLHVLLVSGLLTLAAMAAERLVRSLRLPVRWVWAGALGLTAAVVLLSLPGAPLAPASDEAPGSALVALPHAGEIPVSPSEMPHEAGEAEGIVAGAAAFLDGVRGLRLLPEGSRAATLLDPALGALTGLSAGVASALPGLPRTLLLAVWGGASLLLLATLLLSALRLARNRSRWPRLRIDHEEVRVSRRMGPALVGLRRPEIVLPAWTLSLPSEHIGLVLLHESEHREAGDTRLLAAGLLPLVLLPWNPFLWFQLARLRQAVELDCDRRVLARGIHPRPYAETLLHVGGREFPGISPIPALTGPARLMKRRIRNMKEPTLLRRIPLALGGGLLAVTFLVLACEMDTPTAEPGTRDAPEAPRAALDLPTGEAPAELSMIRLLPDLDVLDLRVVVDGVDLGDAPLEVDPVDIVDLRVTRSGEGVPEGADGLLVITTTAAPPASPERIPYRVEELPPEIEIPPPPTEDDEARVYEPVEVHIFEPTDDDALREDFIEGRISGARVRTGSDDEGSFEVGRVVRDDGDDPSVRLRSRTPVRSGSAPLIVVDGIIQASPTIDLDSSEIAKTEVVRGSAAEAEYGSRAAHGVILVTTHR
jgi:hypothetical protein